MIKDVILIISIILILILGIIVYKNSTYYYIYNYNYEYNPKAPKIIHLIYIPWDKNQKLKDNYMDFDHTFYIRLRDENPDYNVKLWTLPYIKNFLNQFYPQFYDTIFNLPRPTMIVDFMRLLVVYHYGGIYWQYGSTNKAYSMDHFLPMINKNVKLFTEGVLSKYYSEKMSTEPIRKGKPEEVVRICNQIFSAVPRHSYIYQLFLKAIYNSKIYTVKKDYDILYIGANAMMSEMYNDIGKYRCDIELVDYKTTRKMIKISSNGSWRIEKS
jgi:hypothetical protein